MITWSRSRAPSNFDSRETVPLLLPPPFSWRVSLCSSAESCSQLARCMGKSQHLPRRRTWIVGYCQSCSNSPPLFHGFRLRIVGEFVVCYDRTTARLTDRIILGQYFSQCAYHMSRCRCVQRCHTSCASPKEDVLAPHGFTPYPW